ncbi:MAG: hypothetical protein IT366_08620 [Candidatus Hydrogenedentes bacterium]|nr:hypothetical protein [Candidatus Hydrogenedentota bacterium]
MIQLRKWAVLWVAAAAFAQDTPYQTYMARIEALQQSSAEIAQRSGRDVLIQQYRDIVAEYPGYANNIRLETQIAMLYESDFSDLGQPPDYAAAHETYQNIIANYEADHPYMPTVRRLGADRAVEIDPKLARDMYEGIVTDYPDHDALVVQSEYALGKLAASQGDMVTAQQHFDRVLGYVPSGAEVSEADAANIEAYQNNTVSTMLTNAIDKANTPQERMKALKKFLEKNKELEQRFGDLVQRFAHSVDRGDSAGADEADENGSVEALLASIKKNKSGDDSARRDRSRTREERARDAEGEKTRMARLEATAEEALQAGTNAATLAPDAMTSRQSLLKPATATHRLAYSIAAVCIVGLIAGTAGLYAARRSM